MEAQAAPKAGTRGPPVVRPIVAADIPAVVAVTRRCPEAAQWSREDYERAARGEFAAWVALCEPPDTTLGRDALGGFIISRRTADEMEILNLAVDPSARRRGLARRLLEAALHHGHGGGARKVFLEVRASNSAALAFYQAHGFSLTGRRTRYYSDPLEDALVLSRQLGD